MPVLQINAFTFIAPTNVTWYINGTLVTKGNETYITKYELLNEADQSYRYYLIINDTTTGNTDIKFNYLVNNVTYTFNDSLEG